MAYLSCEGVSKFYRLQGDPADNSGSRIIPSLRIRDNLYVALEGVGFSLSDGDRLGIIGLNGAGKSTLLRIISGIVRPSSGKVTRKGNIASILEPGALLLPDLTGTGNILFQGRMLGLEESTVRNRLPDIARFSDLGHFINEPVKNYSQGMSLRLAMGILKELRPDILLLDEVLAMGDIMFREAMSNEFKEAFSDIPITLLVSHELTEIFSKCNKCLVLEHGSMVYFGDVPGAIAYYYGQSRKAQLAHECEVGNIKAAFEDQQYSYRPDQGIAVRIDFDVFEDMVCLFPLMNVFGPHGPALTDSPVFHDDKPDGHLRRGSYSCRVTLPPFTFNIGEYQISVTFGDGQRIFAQRDNVLSFRVMPGEWEIGAPWTDMGFKCPVRPKLKWVF